MLSRIELPPRYIKWLTVPVTLRRRTIISRLFCYWINGQLKWRPYGVTLPGLPLDRGLGYYYFIWPKLVRCSPRRLCVLPIVPVGSHLWGQLPIISVLVNSDVFCCFYSMFSNLLRLPLILSPDCSIWCITNKKWWSQWVMLPHESSG